MKNKGLISLILILAFFALLDFLIIDKFKGEEEKNNRVFLISNIENLELTKGLEDNIEGDYLVKFNFEDNLYTISKIEDDMILIDGQEYAETNFYKEDDYNKYIHLLENNLDVKINEYFNVLPNNIITNVSEEGKEVYSSSKKNINDMLNTLNGNTKSYNPEDNTKWLRVLNGFDIDTNKTFNKKILKESAIKIKENKNYKEKFYFSFIEQEEIKDSKSDLSELNYVGKN